PDLAPELAAVPQSALNDGESTHEILRVLRRLVDAYPGDRVLVGEVWLLMARTHARYFGRGDELHLLFELPAAVLTAWDAGAWRRSHGTRARHTAGPPRRGSRGRPSPSGGTSSGCARTRARSSISTAGCSRSAAPRPRFTPAAAACSRRRRACSPTSAPPGRSGGSCSSTSPAHRSRSLRTAASRSRATGWARTGRTRACSPPRRPSSCGRSGLQRPRDLGLERAAVAALIERHVRPLVVADVELLRARDLLLLVEQHLGPLRHPARRARDGEQDREHGDREPHRLVDDARVEVDVGIEPARHEVVVLQRDALEVDRDVDERVLPRHLEHLVSDPLDDLRARVVVLVDAVAEAGEPQLAG